MRTVVIGLGEAVDMVRAWLLCVPNERALRAHRHLGGVEPGDRTVTVLLIPGPPGGMAEHVLDQLVTRNGIDDGAVRSALAVLRWPAGE